MDIREQIAQMTYMDIREQIALMTSEYVDALLSMIRAQSLEALSFSQESAPAKAAAVKASASPKKAATSERLKRRSPEDIQKDVGRICTFLRAHRHGARSEEIRKALNLEPREMPRLLREGLAGKAFYILSGQKRSTVYTISHVKKKPVKAKAAKAKAVKAKAKVRASAKAKSPTKAKAKPKKTAKAKAEVTEKDLNGAVAQPS